MASNTTTPSRIATPWGRTTLVEQVTLPQSVGDKRFKSLVELLETEKGDYLVRIAYSTDGSVRRGPVTLRPKDIEKLHTALAKTPALAAVLGLGGDA
ncbi:MAG TPA: hypothetical protein VGU02_01115 [Gaiellaceae bacterium]|nr:hypothetical protein [Gaiellaceae bacterium]